MLRDVEAASIPSYQIEAVPRTIGGAAVLEPRIEGDNMQAVLAMFRGETSLADAPVQSFEPTTTPATRPGEPAAATTPATAPPAEVTTPPEGSGPQENNVGIVPPRDVQCP